MALLEQLRSRWRNLVGAAKSEYAAHEEKSESDIAADPAVAGSRANSDGDDGSYVGRTSPQYDAETEQSGAEARSEADGMPDH